MGLAERRKRGPHWYDTTRVPPGGDAGYYFVLHRNIDRLRYKLGRLPLARRQELVPEIERELEQLTDFLTAYRMDKDKDLELTLAEVNLWLPGFEIQRRPKRS